MSPARWEGLQALIQHLNGAVKALALYPATHPAAAKFQDAILQSLTRVLAHHESVQVGVTEDGLLVVDSVPWMGQADQVNALLDRMRKRDVGTVSFRRGADLQDVRSLLDILAMDPGLLAAQGGAAQYQGRKAAGQGHLLVSPLPQAATEDAPDPRELRGIYMRALDVARAVIRQVRLGAVPDAAEVRRAVAGLTAAVLRDARAALGLTLMKSYDEYLFTHSVNVGILAIALGHSLGLDREALREVGFGAFLHDIGKVTWPEWLHRKPGALTAAEWEVVRQHPVEGVKLVEPMDASDIATAIVLEHHVRFDGGRRGYPTLPAGRAASLYGRLACVADCYDAMTTYRPYKHALEPSQAVTELKAMGGTAYDPKIVEAFVQMVGFYPVGTLVRLSTGELAVVLRPQEDPVRPRVRLVAAPDGTLLENGSEIDLQEKNPRTKDYARSIALAVNAGSKNLDPAQLVAAAAPQNGTPPPR